ncbi:MAG: response regulator, partial [Deltaproteobacteria bacterium]|nr:response regulator [Deltaproteobacteria bacterium]
ANGKGAIEMARAISPDVILMDIMMPVMDGLEAVKILKQDAETRIIPVVMVAALREVNDRVKALEAGADDFLSKPVDKIELRIRVQTLVKVKAYNDSLRDYQKQLKAEVDRKTIQLQKTLEALQIASLDSIQRLSRAAEYRDEDTGSHIERMSRYSEAVAKKMGLDGKTVERILFAAPMHDVGKIGIPDKILLKPGKLDPDEWEIIKQHTTIGARILEGSRTGFIKLAEVIALTHHERWDGSGYPRGLKGARIPLVGRITAIADVFDALTSRRPYKEPFSVEKSFAIIQESKRTHFDPDIVDAFFAIQDEILAIKEAYQE